MFASQEHGMLDQYRSNNDSWEFNEYTVWCVRSCELLQICSQETEYNTKMWLTTFHANTYIFEYIVYTHI